MKQAVLVTLNEEYSDVSRILIPKADWNYISKLSDEEKWEEVPMYLPGDNTKFTINGYGEAFFYANEVCIFASKNNIEIVEEANIYFY